MPLFQNSVLKKYLKQQDSEAVAKAYKKFTKYFHDPKIQENIRSSKEEEYQGIFLTELFSKILGYTMKPNANFNLVAEYKNEKNSKKADGAILKDDQAVGVIELKGTNTKDLEKVRQQAFDYKANQTGCVYVITSNFEKIRFYINNAVDFEEFDLFSLKADEFELLYLCLAQENLINHVPLKIKEASVQEEEAITKKFYKDYSTFKRELFRDLVKLNMKNEVFRAELNNEDKDRANKNIKQNLFKKSQKLIDRFLFIFFAEDRGLLPPNSTIQILDQWNRLKDDDAYFPLYHRYKIYFNYLDQGRKGTDKKAEIFAYNGGLFKPDPVLDSLLISDDLLYKHTKDLQAYDFESQVDVNILGHIFENSLNEIESVNAEIEGTDFDKQTTKRKKDGVFYTPKYITKYIVDNTVGKLCNEKKDELGVVEEEYLKSRKGRSKAKLKELLDNLEAYREWLLQITILDPACGSGAFLNQALDFLIKEHEYISELQTNLLGGGFVFPDIENTVLENNIYGVDLNEESVEIAKLSLWLRTAQPRRKLNDLSSNIKCGNSLIDSKTVAGDKAFKWEDEFSQIFTKGGFDVVIGNPPYGAFISKQDQEFYIKIYKTPSYKLDTYSIFVEKGIELIKEGGMLGFIVPYTWMTINQHYKLREHLFNYEICEIIDLPQKIFSDADLDTVIINMRKKVAEKNIAVGSSINSEILITGNISLKGIFNNPDLLININLSDEDSKILEKVRLNESLEKQFEVSQGYIPYRRSDLIKQYGKEEGNKIVDERLWHSNVKKDDEWKQEIQGRDLSRYFNTESFQYIKYGKHLAGYVSEKFFKNPRILVMEVTRGHRYKISATLVEKEYYNTPSIINIIQPENNVEQLKFLLGIFNSKLVTFYHIKAHPKANAVTSIPKILIKDIRNLPLPTLDNLNSKIVGNVDYQLLSKQKGQAILDRFNKYIHSHFKLDVVQKKLLNWHELEFGDFIKELNKAIKKENKERVKAEQEPIPILTKLKEMEWMDVFETKKAEAQALKAEIDRTDREIDQMVYELYGLNEEEIKIVERS